MPTYRAYRLNQRGRIVTGEWLEADDDRDAAEQAAELCDEATPSVELWQAARKVEEIDCEDGDES